MNKNLLLILISTVVAVSTVLLFSTGSATTLEHIELVVSGTWGEKDTDFGILYEGEWPGPSTFCVDGIGNIYVTDDVNLRFKKYDCEGKLLTVKTFKDVFYYIEDMTISADGTIFILACKKPHRYLSIATMDSVFNIKNERVARELLGDYVDNYSGMKLTVDTLNRLYLKGLPKKLVRISDLNEVECLNGAFYATSAVLVKFETVTDTLQEQAPVKINIAQGKLENDRLLKIAHTGPRKASFYGIDGLNRVYLMSRTVDKNKGLLSVYAYDGLLLNTVSIRIDFIHFSAGSHYGKIGLDNNYYQINSDTTGFYIYRYTICDK